MRAPMVRKCLHLGAVQPDCPALRRVVARDNVQCRGLAAAVGANQSVHLTGPNLEIETVDRTDPAEAQRHLFQRQRAGIGGRGKQPRNQVGARNDRAVAFERAAVLEIQDLGNSAGNHQHDDEQQHRIEKRRPRDQRCCEFRQHGQQNRAEQRPENGASPPDQDGDEEQDRQVEREGVRRDVGLQGGEQAAGNRGDGAAEHEHGTEQRGF